MAVSYHSHAIEQDEFNLAKMEIRTIHEARKRFPNATLNFIAEQLGISEKTLYRKMYQYDIALPNLKNQDKTKKRRSKMFPNGIDKNTKAY